MKGLYLRKVMRADRAAYICFLAVGSASLATAQITITTGISNLPDTAESFNGRPLQSHIEEIRDQNGGVIQQNISFTQTGLESLSIYNGASGPSPVTTFGNVSMSITPSQLTPSATRFGWEGGPGSMTYSAPGHSNLLTLSWDKTFFAISNGAGTSGHNLSGEGNLTASGDIASWYNMSVGSATYDREFHHFGTLTLEDGTVHAQLTPEPFSAVGLGLAGVGLFLRKRRKANTR